jgi:hypothetical protein
MQVDLKDPLFWVMAGIWFTVPILSWGWSLLTLHFYRKLTVFIKDATSALEQAKTLNEQMLNYRLETLAIRTQAEEEIRLACKYYSKITELIDKEKEKKE